MNKPEFPKEYFYDEVKDGFYISEMMKRYWAAQLEVLKVIDDICRNHNIKWFATYGTLLGAVRHKGFIPWDDDIDIAMLRDDYDRFFDVVKRELPKGYCILNTKEQNEYAYPFGRITNSHFIDLTPDYLEKYHGCPYVVGVDIYPYDNLFDDSEKEKERDVRGYDIFKAIKMLTIPEYDHKDFDNLLQKIENDNKVTLDKSMNLNNQLGDLLGNICSEAKYENSKEISLLYSWILYKGYKFPKKIFEDLIELPFECTSIPVPAKYHEILTSFFGDYNKVVRSCSGHEYPVFREQEKIYRNAKGSNPYRYTLRADAIPPKRHTPTDSDVIGKDILFLPCKIQWWDTMKPVFEGAIADTRNTVSIVPIPHFDCDYLGNVGQVHINENDFKELTELQKYLTTFEGYGLGPRKPDVIVIQVPYDAWSCTLTVPEILYSDNLAKFTNELVYVPCFDTLIPEKDDDIIIAALLSLIEQPVVVNADKILLKHEKIKEIYLNTLLSLTSPSLKEYWESKLCLMSDVPWIKVPSNNP